MNKDSLRADEHAVDLYLRVTPNSSRPGIAGLHTGGAGKPAAISQLLATLIQDQTP